MNRTNLKLTFLGLTFTLNDVLVRNAQKILILWMVCGAALLALTPWALIASLNTLFPALAIGYGLGEYVSMLLILLILLAKN
jgi:hypothetical protein